MLIRLTLTDFRNHAAVTLEAGNGFNVLSGPNGAGKTNILEAISLLAPGRGLRRAALSDMAREGGAGGFGVAAELPNDVRLGTGTQSGSPERRIVRVNGAGAPATALAEWLSILWLTPAMDRLFVEPAGERRRFLDRLTLALDPGHAAHASRYDAAMRERNRLLEDPAPDPDWLAALEARMVEHGLALAEARTACVAALDGRIADAPSVGFPRAALRLEGWAGDAARLAADLRGGRSRDAAAGRALAGPHRVDLIVTDREREVPAARCSTGEQKALLLGLVLAHAELVATRADRPPALLLDEVAAHLDPQRRAALFARAAGIGQVWLTGTEPGLFDDIPGDARRFDITAGQVAVGRRP
ncbi:DNA replication/repair protein RecF [Sphingomonas sp. CFBP 13720]|uniref:DNA replication/repair protein RecF n=1 Tax=Sphingomonas sp. CFBP 13720 TaxID=2775302 RepID=UPI00177FF1DE|nr:DNA replication/repair protein RecF [Sphingomonas sp. CFBP 13720]MBD8678051.1 DNA replication/repair protein RecF [Sphingomonas sp. CFBP 13720]